MANYYCTARTNYFRVKPECEENYKEFFKHLFGDEDNVHDFTKTTENGTILHGFGSYSSIEYFEGDPEEDDQPSDMFAAIQPMLPDDEAFIYTEAGAEKLRYVEGLSVVVTSKGIRYLELNDIALDTARKLLGNPEFTTQSFY